MALGGVGYFGDNYFATQYWAKDYWTETSGEGEAGSAVKLLQGGVYAWMVS